MSHRFSSGSSLYRHLPVLFTSGWETVSQPDAAFAFLPFAVQKRGSSFRADPSWDISTQLSRAGGTYYVKKTGSDAADGLSWATAKASVQNAIASATANSVIYIDAGWYGFSDGGTKGTAITKNISLIGVGTVILDAFIDATYTQTGGYTNVWECSQTYSISHVGNYATLDSYSVPAVYSQQSSIATVDANEGSWWRDTVANKLYIHTIGHGAPNSNVRPQRASISNLSVTTASISMYLENIVSVFGAIGLAYAPTSTNSVYANGCVFARSVASATGCAYVASGAYGYFRNCKFVHSNQDGLNGDNSHIAEINCEGAYNGVTGGADIYNGSTNHGAGVHVVINGNYHHNMGPNSAYINTCKAWMLGTNCHDSVAVTVPTQNVNFQNGSTMWLDTCTGSGSTYDFSAAAGQTIYTRNFTGTGNKTGSGTVTTY